MIVLKDQKSENTIYYTKHIGVFNVIHMFILQSNF